MDQGRGMASGVKTGMLRQHSWSLGAGVSCLALVLASPAQALVFNNNVAPDTAAAANIYDSNNIYDNVVSVITRSATGDGLCTGTLINSRTILTASHCMWNAQTETVSKVEGIRIGFSPNASSGETPNDQRASGMLVNPNYRDAQFGYDVALISLSTPVTSIAPVQVVGDDASTPAKGALAEIVGYGQYGTGLDAGMYYDPDPSKEAPGNARRRYGQTVVGDYTKWTFDRTGDTPMIVAQFRNPDSPDDPDYYGLSELGVPVPAQQAGNGGGDSGGPLFLVMEDGSLVQYGILGLLNPAQGGTLRYGVISGWEFIQNYSAWLAQNNPLRTTSALAGHFNWSDAGAWRDDKGYSEVPDNAGGSFAGPRGMVGRYYDVFLSQASSIHVDISPTIDNLTLAHGSAVLDIARGNSLQTVLDTRILAGTVATNGVLSARQVILQGGALSGTGDVIVSAGLQHAGGVIAPGTATALGILSVHGDYQAGDAAILSVRLGAEGADRLAVSGTAQVNGTLQYGLFSPAHFGTYIVATAQNGLSGSFDQVTGPASAFASVEALYAGDGVALSVTKARSFASAGMNANQMSVGAALDSMEDASALVAAATWLPDATSAARTFENMSGQAYASLETVMLEDSRFTREAAFGRLRAVSGGAGTGSAPATREAGSGGATALPGAGPDVWMKGFGSFGNMGARDGNAGVKRDIGGFYAGVDREVFDTWRIGLLGGYSRTTASLKDLAASFSSDNYTVGLYGGQQWGALALRLGVSQTWHDISAARAPTLPMTPGSLKAEFNASTAQVFGELGYQMHLGTLHLEPFANLAYVSVSGDDFHETGNIAALRSSGLGGSATFSTLGLRLSAPVFTVGETRISAHASAGWQHAWNGQPPAIVSSFVTSAAFSSTGMPLASDTALLEAGLDTDLSQNIRLGVFYSGQFGGGISDNGFQAALKVSF